MTIALSIKNLEKTYDTGFQALKGINLEVKQGDFFALLGPNGAGKSTTIGIICSLINKSSGTVEVFGQDIDKNFSLAKKDLGVVPQEFNFSMFEKVIDIVSTQAGFYGLNRKQALEKSEHYLKKLGLWDKRNEKARFLSGGMKRRLMIVRALVHEPRLLILDEPTAGVDIELRRSMWEFMQEINDAGTTIILTTHYLEEAESLCRNIAIIDQGKIVKNTDMRSLLTQLSTETFILDVRDEIENLPVLDGYELNKIDSRCFEVIVEKEQNLNPIFEQLSQQGIEVVSMRNKINRLEELFVSLVENHGDGTVNVAAEEVSK
ncbi:MAG: ABC transporter ATP-binding protein [Pseudomonadales bacterium]|nr:ABC transporter ATP-binding protein [Pseudomonadales bacterium]